MKALIVIELPEDHLIKATNDLYDRLKGYQCELKPMPDRIDWFENGYNGDWIMYSTGWNACIEEIEK